MRQKKTNLLIMGWHGQAKEHVFTLGSTVDPVIERVPCNVAVLKDCGGEAKYQRVLVPLAGGPNGALALEIATILAEPETGQVVALNVDTGRQVFDIEAMLDANADRLSRGRQQVTPKTVQAADVVEAILAEAEDYDLVVMGCTREPLIYQITRETIPETIARRCGKPMVMAKASAGIRSWIRRWL